MGNWWVNIIFLITGGIIGFVTTFCIEYKKREWAKEDQEKRNSQMLEGLEKEIEEGIKRCEGLVGFLENDKVSFSRIYTSLWDSSKSELLQNLKYREVLVLLHRIYYRFDLINFNMERGRLEAGAAFAKEYIEEIKENFGKLKDILEEN